MGEATGFAAISGSWDMVGYFRAGGFFMWPLLVISLVALTFFIERIVVFFIQKRKLSPAAALDHMDGLLEEGKSKNEIAQELIELCELKKGVASVIFQTGMEKYQNAISTGLPVTEVKKWMVEGIEDRAKTELPILDAHINILGICFTVSPLIGLLGTVAGMIQAFRVMAESGGGAKPDELAEGIAVALLTTAGGLIIAIPTMIAHTWVKSTADTYGNQIEEAAMEMVDAMVTEQSGDA